MPIISAFSDLDYSTFSLNEGERSVVAPGPHGRDILRKFVDDICSVGQVEHKFGTGVAPSSFANRAELEEILKSPLAHSDWFISFANGSRGFLDFDDDLLILLFGEKDVGAVANALPLRGLYDAAHHEHGVIQGMGAPESAIGRFGAFLERALR